MSGGLLSGLDRAERRPYQGWKTNSSLSPENDDVCLLEDLSTKVNNEGSPNRTECLSNGDRNPGDFKAHDSSYKIPKKTNSSNVGAKRGDEWFESSFEVKLPPPGRSKYRQASSISGKKRYDADRITQRNEIGYRALRQGVLTSPSRRWKHADAPGWRQSELSRSQQENILSCQVPDHRSNGTVSASDKSGNIQRNFKKGDKEESSKTLIEECEHSVSMLDCFLRENSVRSTKPNKDENGRTNSSDSDTNLETSIRANSLQDSTSPSKDISPSDNNHEDVFCDHCEKCLKRLTEDKKCRNCSNNVFPSQAATPRTHLSSNRFYASDKEKTKIRTYANQRRGNTPVLIARPDTEPSATPESSGGSRQEKSGLRKRKSQGKSATCSDSDLSPGRPKRGSKQLKLSLTKKVDVITLSDEEESTDTVTELTVEESPLEATFSGPDDITSGPGALSDGDDDKDADVITDSINTKMTPKTRAKRKTPLSKEKLPAAKKKADNVDGYTRDDAEIEIMIREEVRIGNLACTATEPLKIICKTDEIRLNVECGTTSVPLTIAGNDLNSFKMSQFSNPNVIVLGVTPGFAMKVCQKLPKHGKFLNPGSAVSAERDIVLEVSEEVKREVIADVEEWVTDKLSKEFAELSLKEVERIKSFKLTPLLVKEKSKEPNGVSPSTSPMSTRTRTYNTRASSHRQPVQTVEKLIVYPLPPQPGGITVTSEDIPCLAEGEFLNDVIIDFYLKFVFFEKLKPEDRERTHILSSFFYKRLTQKNNDSDNHASLPERMHSQVKTWTKSVDIFNKDFVFVPINENSHWYLAVICFAGHTKATHMTEITDDDETNAKDEDPDTDQGTEKESENDEDGSEGEGTDVDLPSLAKIQTAYSKRGNRKKSVSTMVVKSQPCILVFDSLGGVRQRCMMNLRNYLQVEWKVRKKDSKPREFSKEIIKGNHPKVPQQDNFCDCGVYVLQYMESFFKDPITDFSLPIKKPQWFQREEIATKRNDIRELIYNLKAAACSGN